MRFAVIQPRRRLCDAAYVILLFRREVLVFSVAHVAVAHSSSLRRHLGLIR